MAFKCIAYEDDLAWKETVARLRGGVTGDGTQPEFQLGAFECNGSN